MNSKLATLGRLARNPLGLTAGALIVAGAMFGVGYVAADASSDDSSHTVQVVTPGVPPGGRETTNAANSSGQAPPAIPAADKGIATDGPASGSPGFGGAAPAQIRPGACQGELTGAIVDGKVDPAAAGLKPAFLGSGFRLVSVSLRAEGPCDDAGKPTASTAALDTVWTHTDTGLQAYVSQRVSTGPIASVIGDSGANFTADGYDFYVSVNGGPVYIDKTEPARPAIAPGEPAPGGQGDPNVQHVMEAAIAQLASGVRLECFYRQAAGSWSDLGTLGIGDPRPALPTGFSEVYSQFVVYTEPAAGCDTPKLETRGSFSANFATSGSEAKGGGNVSINAYGLPGDAQPGPGYMDDSSANWSNGKYQFSIYGNRSDGPLGADSILAIARAMDPDFGDACLVRNQQLSPADVERAGFHTPAVPEGFTIQGSSLTGTEMAGDCSGIQGGPVPQYSLSWQLFNEATSAFIQANVYSAPEGKQPGSDFMGSISDTSINWVDGNGSSYNVNGFAKLGASPSRETLIAVAKSLDPTLDVSKLQEAVNGAATGGGSTGSAGAVPPAPADKPLSR